MVSVDGPLATFDPSAYFKAVFLGVTMANANDRITELEIQLSHQTQVIDDLSDMVAKQGDQLDRLARRVSLLLENAADAQAGAGGVILADQKPPHW